MPRSPSAQAPVGAAGADAGADAVARFDRLDALRGGAMVWMAVFHGAFDLNHAGLLHQDFYTDPRWTVQRTCILSLFLLCAGAGSAIAADRAQPWPRFWRRWGQVVACSALVSLGSWWMFPRSWIHFGVLHGMAVLLLIARLAAPLRGWAWLLGAAALVLPRFVQHPFFDTPWTDWTGLVTRLPVTEDYVPVLPWLGVVLWGQAGAAWLLRARSRRHWLAGAGRWQPLAVLGRWPLSFYMLHQPVLLGLLAVAVRLP